MTKPPDFSSSYGEDAWKMIVAAASGDAPSLRDLLQRNSDLIKDDYSHGPPLLYAVREGRVEAVRLLLEAGANPGGLVGVARERGFDGIAELLQAALDRSKRVIPAETFSDHAIHATAEAGDLKRVRAFLDADPSLIHRRDRSGGTPLHRAAIGRSRPVVQLLLDRGADIHAIHGNGESSPAGYAPRDHQPIDLAIWGGPRRVRPSVWRIAIACLRYWLRSKAPVRQFGICDIEMVRLLLSRGASYNLPLAAALGDLERVRAILDEDAARIREIRPNGRLALSAAAEFGRDEIVRLLLDRGADPTWPDADDSRRGSALHYAARNGNRAMVELLLRHGADPNGCVDSAGNAVFAAKTPEIRRLLFDHGGKLDPFDLVWLDEDDEVMRRVKEEPESAHAGCGGVFTAVCTRGKRKLMVRLLEAGVRVPPLASGCQSYLLENAELLRLLLKYGMSPDYANWQNHTLLHCACSRDGRGRAMNNRLEAAAILLDAGANISLKDHAHCSTPLATAARNNLPDMVRFLLSRGAPTNLPDDKPWAAPLAWATRRGHREIVEILRAHGAV